MYETLSAINLTIWWVKFLIQFPALEQMSKLHIYELEKPPLSVSRVFYAAFKTNNIITLRHLSSHENELWVAKNQNK